MIDEAPWVRAPVVRIVDHPGEAHPGDAITVLGARVTRRFDGDSASLVRAVLALCARPITRAQLHAALAIRAGDGQGALPPAAAAVVDELVALLAGDDVLIPAAMPAPAPDAPRAPPGPRRRIVLGISGAVAAVDAPAVIRELHAAGCDVQIALTRSGARMVSPTALAALTHARVFTRLAPRDASSPVPHVELAAWAELVLICPASATTLSRIATGHCGDLVAAIVAATRAPVVLVPSMNDAMYGSPAIQANLDTLRAHGRYLVHPAYGVELADPPHARLPRLGAAPPARAVVDVVRHVLAAHPPADRRPPAPTWEAVWASAPDAQLPWRADAVEPPLAAALAAHAAPGRRLVDVGTGDGLVAIAAAAAGYQVTALDVAPSALGRARARADAAGAREIVLVLDDVTAPRLPGGFDVAVDRGVLHALPPDQRAAWAAGVDHLIAPGGVLLVVAHVAAASPAEAEAARARQLATTPVSADELAALLPAFRVVAATPTTLAGAPAALFELARVTAPPAPPAP